MDTMFLRYVIRIVYPIATILIATDVNIVHRRVNSNSKKVTLPASFTLRGPSLGNIQCKASFPLH